MTWNYRICKKKTELPGEDAVSIYTIREVYYDDNDKIIAVAKEPVYPVGESVSELYRDCLHILEAFDRPVVNLDNLCFPVEE